MNPLKKTIFITATIFLMFFIACGGGGNNNDNTNNNNNTPTVSISITQTLNMLVGETKTLSVTRQNTDDFTLSVSPASGSSCVKSGINAVTCTPTAAGTYTVTVTATADTSKSASATVTVTESNQSDPSTSDTYKLSVRKFGEGVITGNGINCGDTCDNIYNEGTTVTLTASAGNAWEFRSWAGCDSVNGASCTITIDADKTALPTFGRQTLQIYPDVVVLEDAAMSAFIRNDGTTYYFYSSAAQIGALKPGDIIVSGKGEGLLRKVTSVQTFGDQIVLETTDASLSEVVREGTISWTKHFTEDDPGQEASAANGAQLMAALSQVRLAESDGGGVKASLKRSIDKVLFDDKGIKVEITGSIELSAALDIAWDYSEWGLQEFKTTFITELNNQLSLKASGKSPELDITKELFRKTFEPVFFMVGPVPVVIIPEVVVYVGVKGNADGSVTATVHLNTNRTAGVYWKNGEGWSSIDEYNPPAFTWDPIVASAKASLSGRLSPAINLMLYGLIGPQLRLEGSLEAKIQANAEVKPGDAFIHLNAALYGGFGAYVSVQSDVLKMIGLDIGKYEKELFGAQWKLAEWGFEAATPDPEGTPDLDYDCFGYFTGDGAKIFGGALANLYDMKTCKLVADKSGIWRIGLTNLSTNGNVSWSLAFGRQDPNLETIISSNGVRGGYDSGEMFLQPGEYYVTLSFIGHFQFQIIENVPYSLLVTYEEDDGRYEDERNNSWEEATEITFGEPKIGSLLNGYDADWFKFKTDTSGKYRIKLNNLSTNGNVSWSLVFGRQYPNPETIISRTSSNGVRGGYDSGEMFLEPGEYYVALSFSGQFQFQIIENVSYSLLVSNTEGTDASPTYVITATPSPIDFGSVQAPYTQPVARTVTVTNTGTGSVTLTRPTATNYDIGALSTTTLASNATSTFTIRPKANLPAGTYNETITISGGNGASATVSASFAVTTSSSGGVFTTIVHPELGGTSILGINDNGQVVGTVENLFGGGGAFLKDGDSFIEIAHPDHPYALYLAGNVASGINNSGQVVGYWFDFSTYDFDSGSYEQQGFLYDGSYTKIILPAGWAFEAGGKSGINDSGQVAGCFTDSDNKRHGFLKDGNNYTVIDYPGAADGVGTCATGLNNKGQIVGYFQDANGYNHGFLKDGGSYTLIDHPDAVGGGVLLSGTIVHDINDSGQIVGSFLDSNNIQHGFLKDSDRFITIDHPDATNSTSAVGINNYGQIVGSYSDGNGTNGFLLEGI